MIFFYKILVNFLFLLVLLFLPFVYLFSEKRRANLLPRLGINSGFKKKTDGEKRIWVHALSVGEVISALPFVKALKEKQNNLTIIFTASTQTGFDMAKHLLKNEMSLKGNRRVVDQLGYSPFDLGICIKKICGLIQPDSVVIVETDLWPNFLYEMNKKSIPVILINARLSKHSLKGYLFLKRFSSMFFSFITHIITQTQLDKKRFQSFGVDKKKISVAGNIKFDQIYENRDEKSINDKKDILDIQSGEQVFLAGSTHEGEEKILCNVYKKIKKKIPKLILIIAPRDPRRCSAVKSYFKFHAVSAEFMSDVEASKRQYSVILVDRMGELVELYAVCDLAFIGGSMVKEGGHNPLEPAAFAKPVLFGADMSNFLLISKMLTESGGARRVESEIQLEKEIETILGSSQIQQQMGLHNFEIFSQNSGAVKRILEKMEHLDIL